MVPVNITGGDAKTSNTARWLLHGHRRQKWNRTEIQKHKANFKNLKQNETLNLNSCQFTTTTALVSIVPIPIAVEQS